MTSGAAASIALTEPAAQRIAALLAAGVTVALRRADEMGDAITARGGTGQISAAPSRPRAADWVAIAVCVAVGVLGVWVIMRAAGR